MHEEQPRPKNQPGKQSIWQMVIKDMENREKLGIDRYGEPVQTFNGRDSLLDAYEEQLDKIVYLKQHMEELKELGNELLIILEEANRGINVNKMLGDIISKHKCLGIKICDKCRGSGDQVIQFGFVETCIKCKGKGYV